MYSYNARQVVAVWGTTVLTESMPESGENLTVSRNTPSTELAAQMGNSVAVMRNDRTGTVTVTVYSHSAANTALSEALNRQERGIRVVAKSLMVKDYNSEEIFSADTAVIAGPPTAGFSGDGAPTRQWTLLCGELNMVFGEGQEVIPETT